MKNFVTEASGKRIIGGGELVNVSKPIAQKFDVPVEWLLAAMSWETTQYSSYDPDKLWVPGAIPGKNWIDPADFHGTFPTDLLHWAHNSGDWGFGLVGFTPWPLVHINPLRWKPGDKLPDPASQAKLRMTPLEQLKNCVEDYFRTNIRRFSIPTPFATIEDFYCVVYSPGMSGKSDSYNVQWAGRTYNKGTQMNIFRRWLSGYEYPKKASETPAIVDDSSNGQGPWDMPAWMMWAPGSKWQGWIKTKAIGANVRSGPGTRFPVVRTLLTAGSRFACLDVVTGDIVNGNTDWFKIGPNEFISGTLIAISD